MCAVLVCLFFIYKYFHSITNPYSFCYFQTDFEVHREGKHAAGHTFPGAKPEGTYVGAVPAAVQVKGNTTNIYAAGPAGVVPGAPAVPGAYPTGTYPSTRQ